MYKKSALSLFVFLIVSVLSIFHCKSTETAQGYPGKSLSINHQSELVKLKNHSEKSELSKIIFRHIQFDETTLQPLAEYPNLKVIEIKNSRFKGKVFAGNIAQIQELHLSDVVFKDTRSSGSLENFKSLRVFVMSGFNNSVQGGFDFRSVCRPGLESLEVMSDGVKRPGPLAGLENCADLKVLSMKFMNVNVIINGRLMRVDDKDSKVISRFRNLRVLGDHSGFINDRNITYIQGLTGLESLSIGRSVSDKSINSLLSLKKLRKLHLNMDKISEDGFEKIFQNLTGLNEIFLWSSKISNKSVEAMSKLPVLRSFSCINCENIDGGVYDFLKNVKTLRHVDFAHSSVPFSVVKKLKEEIPGMR